MAGSIDDRFALSPADTGNVAELALPWIGRVHDWVITVDHKRLGLMYIGGGLIFFVVAGLQAATIRLQLAVPDAGIVSPQVFNRLMTLHGTAMVFLVGMPILTGFFNYLMPLMIGARDLAATIFQLRRRRWDGRRGQRSLRRMVRLRADDRNPVLARPFHRLLDTQYPPRQRWLDRNCN
jgi:hypothetical protein